MKKLIVSQLTAAFLLVNIFNGSTALAAATSTTSAASWTDSLGYNAILEADIASGENDIDFGAIGFEVVHSLYKSANSVGSYGIKQELALMVEKEAVVVGEWEQKFKQNIGSSVFAGLKNKVEYATPFVSSNDELKDKGGEFTLSAAAEFGLQSIGIWTPSVEVGRKYSKESPWSAKPKFKFDVTKNFNVETSAKIPLNAPEGKGDVTGGLKLVYSL